MKLNGNFRELFNEMAEIAGSVKKTTNFGNNS